MEPNEGIDSETRKISAMLWRQARFSALKMSLPDWAPGDSSFCPAPGVPKETLQPEIDPKR